MTHRLRDVIGIAGQSINLVTRFYKNGVLYNPNSINSVKIYDINNATVLQTLTSTRLDTGVYQVTWSIPVTSVTGYYFDHWNWTAVAGMSATEKTHKFRVNSATAVSGPAIQDLPDQTSSLFVGQKERDFFDSINKELIQRIVNQKIIYYSVSVEHTNVDPLYNESLSKTVYTPVEINALVDFNEPIESSTNWSIDTRYSVSVYVHDKELRERNIEPQSGDFLKFGKVFYEVTRATRPQITFGQIENPVMIKLDCIVSRQSNFTVADS